MTYLEMVQMAIRESGAKIDVPSTIVGQTGLTGNFVRWVQRAWKKIQRERLGTYWRIEPDQQLSLVAGTNEYSLPSTFEGIHKRYVTIHLSGDNEGNLRYRPNDVYRLEVKRETMQQGMPQYFTVLPNGDLAFWPVPDDAYTVNYEGIRRIEALDDTNDLDTPTYLDEDYHEAIVWQAVMIYAIHYEDGAKLQEAQAEFLPFKKYFESRYMDIPTVDTTALYPSYD